MRFLCFLLVLLCGGCVILTPSASMTALEMASLVATNAAAISPSGPANAVVHPYERLRKACIELNPSVPMPDLVPGLQAELTRYGVESRVYENALPEGCRYSIHYTASVEWGQRLFSSKYVPYLTDARLELRERGRVLAASSYKPSLLGYDRWSASRDKIAPSVRVLVQGVEGSLTAPAVTLGVSETEVKGGVP